MAKDANRLIYGFSFYLDKMAANWDGLVLGDYDAVMPLTWRMKWQVKYLYQPAFMQQGGIYADIAVLSSITPAFLEQAAKHVKFAEIMLNYANDVFNLPEGFASIERTNYVLPLTCYESVFRNYKKEFRKNLRRTEKFNLRYDESKDYASVVDLFRKLYNKQLSAFAPEDYENFKSLCKTLDEEQRVIIRIAFDEEENLLAAMILLKDGQRLYNLLSCITPTGRKYLANEFLYDKVAQEFSGTGLVLDLEGSDVTGIAHYYQKLGSVYQPYPFIKWNELHPVVKLFKK